jgi:phosphinothricin acetyltransferase
MSINIRSATVLDVPAILAIYKPYIEGTAITFEYAVPSLDEFTSRFLSIQAQYPWLVCEIDGVIAGYAYGGPTFERTAFQWDAELSIYLSPEYHKRRIGTALYYCLFDLLALQGYYNLYGVITTENQGSIDLHKTLGFTEFAVFKNTGYKLGKWYDVTWLVKPIRGFETEVIPPLPISAIPQETQSQILLKYTQLIKK